MQIITINAGLYSNSFSNIFEMLASSKSSAVSSSAVSLLAYSIFQLALCFFALCFIYAATYIVLLYHIYFQILFLTVIFMKLWRNLLNIYSKLSLWKTPMVGSFKLYCSIITFRSNHLYLINLLIKCFKQWDKCYLSTYFVPFLIFFRKVFEGWCQT